MPCYSPERMYWTGSYTDAGKKKYTFNPSAAYRDQFVDVPCGGCIGCRLEKSRQMAVRAMHEASGYDSNLFLTLTFDDWHVPRTIAKSDLQLFLKRYRKAGVKLRADERPIRYFACGEYGDESGRPHYHAIIFNGMLRDKMFYKRHNGFDLFTSAELNKLWPYGLATVGDVTLESCQYVAGYVHKKVTGEKASEHYLRFDPVTGEVFYLEPEFSMVSTGTRKKGRGLGGDWLAKFGKSDVWPHDYIATTGYPAKVPRYYERQLSELDLERLKSERRKSLGKYLDDCTPHRRRQRETVAKAKLKLKKRTV